MEVSIINKIHALQNEGNCLFKANLYSEAIAQYNQALELVGQYTESDKKVQILCNRALCYLRLKNIDNTIVDCTEALKIQPKCIKALYRRAKSYELINQIELACADITKAKLLNNKNSEIDQMYRKLISQKNTKEVLQNPTSKKRLYTPLRNCLNQATKSCAVALETVRNTNAVGQDTNTPGTVTSNSKAVPQIHIDTQKIEVISNAIIRKRVEIVKKVKDMTRDLLCLPIQFQTKEQQINFYAVKALCNFGEFEYGRDIETHLKCSFDEMQLRGLMTMYLDTNASSSNVSNRGWDAKFLKKIDINDLSSYFNLPITREERLQTAIYIGKDTIFKPYLKRMEEMLHICGKILQAESCIDFADFVNKVYCEFCLVNSNTINAGNNNSSSNTFSVVLIQKLAEKFQPFCDQHLLTSKYGRSQIKVGFYRNAQLFARDLLLNVPIFKENELSEDKTTSLELEMSPFICLADLTILSILRKLKIIEIFDSNILEDLDLFQRIVDRNCILLKAACILSIDRVTSKLNEHGFALCAWQVDLLFRDLKYLSVDIYNL
jgi:tetratricopeptide (TPR) repeat protein